MSSERKDALKQRLDENYTAFIASLQEKTVSELIAMAPEITAAQQLHEELLVACDEEDVEFLLRFDDPLEVVRGYWESEITGYSHKGEMGHMLWEIRDRELYEKEQLARSPEGVGKTVRVENLTEGERSMSDVKQITTDDLRRMEDQEGLVLQGCGGDPQEWVDGINQELTEAGILLGGSKLENVISFRHDGVTCLLFPFGDAELNIGKFAMWRIQTHDRYGGTWLSDYVPNRLGGFLHQPPRQKPTMTQSYLLLSAVADAAFFFMPIFVAYGAATKLGGTPIYSMISAAALLHGNYTAMVAAGEAVHLLGIPVRLVSYSSSLLPALLIALLAYWVEKGLNKIVPGIFKSLLVGLGTIFVTMIFGYTVLGPLGSFIGTYISMIFVFLGGHVGFIAMGALAACLPWLVMCGMHTALVPFMTQAISDPGYDPVFRPAFILHNMAEGGACIGVGLRTKNTELRAEAFSIGFGCIVAGVTEPAVYGINLRLRKPMFGVMAGGAVGGIVAGLMGARAYVMGYSTVLALPIFQDTMLAMAVGIVVAILVAAAVTFVLGFEDDVPAEDPAPAIESSSTETGTAEPVVYAPVAGTVVAREDIPDETFAAGILGDGVGIEPEKGEVVAPFDGVISSTTDTFHAVGISGPADMELLIHVGVNTVEMKGEGFTLHVKEGDRVKKGQKLITFDIAKIKAAGHPATTAVLVTNSEDYDAFTIEAVQKVAAGAKLITVK